MYSAQDVENSESQSHQTQSVVWITGASSGIGRELALQLAQLGHWVIASARSEERLQALAAEHPNIEPLVADVTDVEIMAQVGRRLRRLTARLDRVILNAGSCEYFDVEQPDWQMMSRVMSVNYFGVVNSLAVALPLLQASDRAHLVAMASQASRVPFPRAQAYGASKAALTYLMESLGVDLASQKIHTTVVQLGFVKTPMTAVNDFPMPFMVSAEEAASEMIAQFDRYPRVIRFPRRISWLISIGEKFPAFWSRFIAPKLSRA